MTRSPQATSATTQYLDAIRALDVLPGATWEVRISPRRRRLGLQVRPDGTVVVAVPVGVQLAQVTGFVAGQRRWLAAAAAKVQARPASAGGKRLVDGEVLDVFGQPHQLRLGTGSMVRASEPVDGTGLLHLPSHLAHDGRALIEWYTRVGMEWIRVNAPAWERRLPLHTTPMYAVRDLGARRLGIYDPRRHLVTLHWPVFQMPPQLVSCTLAHELVHASRPGGTPHGPQFRARFDAVLPGNRVLERQARVAAQKIWRGAVQD